MSIISKVVKDNTDIDDELLLANSIAAAKACAKAYLTASLICTTPELRSLFTTQLSQCTLGQAALIELGIKKHWINPEESPKEALLKLYNKSNCLFNHDQ